MRFLLKKKWNIAYSINDQGSGPLAERILELRGFTGSGIQDDFFEPELRVFHDPYLLDDMERVAEVVIDAVSEDLKVLIFGDYDADGITATAILCHYLRSIGADVSYMIPERLTEGYGLSDDSIERIIAEYPGILITVDNGIASADEVGRLMQAGIKVIVTDHHECKDVLPPAVAVIDPKRKDSTYPFRDLAGAGVALKLVQAISGELGDPDAWQRYTDICTLGTVADMVSLTDENRMIVYHGLKKLNNGGNPGNAALRRTAAFKDCDKITSSTLGFLGAPRINAAGRVGDSSRAVQLLMETDAALCDELAAELSNDNLKRQEIETEIFAEARKMIDEK